MQTLEQEQGLVRIDFNDIFQSRRPFASNMVNTLDDQKQWLNVGEHCISCWSLLPKLHPVWSESQMPAMLMGLP